MKRLNNKGITTVEVLICFALVVIITSSMYSTISSFNQKRITEAKKAKIINYKNLLTKEIQDDFIRVGLTHVDYKKTIEANSRTIYTLDCNLRDGTKRKLIITQLFTKTSYHLLGNPNENDEYLIQYGPPDDLVDYPLPNLGTRKNNTTNKIAYDLSINNVLININSDTNVLSIQIGFYHPSFDTRYGIYIVCPIDYSSSGADETNKFNFD